jgi:hypothetical protein
MSENTWGTLMNDREAILALVDELEAKAGRATPGPYEPWTCDMMGACVTHVGRGHIIFGVTVDGEPDTGNAEYYAALTPERVLPLLRFVRQLAGVDSLQNPETSGTGKEAVRWKWERRLDLSDRTAKLIAGGAAFGVLVVLWALAFRALRW